MNLASIDPGARTIARAFYEALKLRPIGVRIDSYCLWDDATDIWKSWDPSHGRPKNPATWLSNVRLGLLDRDWNERLGSHQKGFGKWEYWLKPAPVYERSHEQLGLGV